MSIQFLPPNPEQKRALEELENYMKLLDTEPSKELKQNIRFVKSFTKSLLLAGKYRYKPEKKHIEIIQKSVHVKPVMKKEIKPIIKPLPPSAPHAPNSMPEAPQAVQIHHEASAQPEILEENGVLRFNIIEPEMDSQDWKIFNQLKPKIRQLIMDYPNALTKEDLLLNEIKKSLKNLNIKYSESHFKKIKYYLIKYLKGYGKIDPLINEKKITSIICNSYNDIKVVYNGKTLNTNIKFDTNEELDNFIMNLAERYHKELSESSPELTMVLPNLSISSFYNPIMGSRFTINKK